MTSYPPHTEKDPLVRILEGAERTHRGANSKEALSVLHRAHQHYRSLAEPIALGRVSTAIGHLLIALGRHEHAIPYLIEAFEIAVESDDTLSISSRGSVLSALLISAPGRADPQKWVRLRKVADLMVEAASKRRNWLGIVDGTLTQVTADLNESGLGPAVQRIRETHAELTRRQASPAAIHLLIARLVELRETYGAEALGPYLRS